MALLMIDGIEDNSSANIFINGTFTPARNGLGYAWAGGSVNNYVQWSGAAYPSTTMYYVGCALRITSDIATMPYHVLICFIGGGSGITQTQIYIEADGSISARRGWNDSLIPGARSAPGLIQTNQWFYLEAKALNASTAVGRVTVRVNNTTVFDINNVATNATANTDPNYNGISIGKANSGGDGTPAMVVDDVYFGYGDDSFLGDIVVETLYPTGDGALNQWVGSDGNSVANYQLVNEVGTPNTSNHVKDSVIGHQDLYTMGDLAVVNAQVLAVGHFVHASKNDSGPASFKILNRGGGGNVTRSQPFGPTTSYNPYSYILSTNPDTGAAWTVAEVNAMQSGIEVTNDVDVLIEPFKVLTAWTTVNGGSGLPTIVAGGRNGTAVSIPSFSYATYTIPVANESDTIIVGAAVNVGGLGSEATIFSFRSDAAATEHCRLRWNSAGALIFYRASSGIGQSANGVITANTWYYIEVKITLSDTVGVFEVRVNGTTVIGPSVNQDTRNAGTKPTFDSLRLQPEWFTVLYDDLYLTVGGSAAFKGNIAVP